METIACVTGADRGLGLSLAKWLLENGYTVFAGRYMEDWDALDRLLEDYPDQLELIPLDIGDDASVQQAAKLIRDKAPHLDLLINNAGITKRSDLANIQGELDFADMAQIYNVNTLGPLRVSHALIELLLQGNNKLVVNISSEAGSVSRNKRKEMYGYCMSKSALNMQSSILHQHLSADGGQVMVFYPGWLQSYMSGELNQEAAVPPDVSADRIMNLVMDHKAYVGEQPIFLDYEGQVWPW